MPSLAAKWNKHTPDFSKLPERVKKPEKDDSEEKKAFIVAFLTKCAADGITTPKQIADAAEKLAGAGDLLGGVTGGVLLGGAAGLAIPTALGYAGGRAAGAARNQMDVDDAETMRLKAEANAYRRRAAEARLGAQVRKIVATDPKKYVVLS
jgi:hypothetical protein